MRKYYTLIFLFYLMNSVSYTQDLSVYGFVVDSVDHRSLAYAHVSIKNSKSGTTCNQSGWFSINVNDSDVLLISSVGYYSKEISFSETKNVEMPIIIMLTEKPIISNEILVETDRKQKKEFTQTGYLQLTNQEIKYLPSIGGESDITKTMQLFPGISSSNEGSSKINVRGGNDDQNLILIDGAQIYNPVHFLSYLSSFNTDAIAGAELLKSYIPSEYSGKLSSVLALRLKDGNSNQQKISGGISFLSAQLYLEGPLSKKITYMLSARRTYLDPLFSLIDADGLGYSFHDIYGKLAMNPSGKDRLYLSIYNGFDKYTNESNNGNSADLRNNWGNTVAHFRYNRIWNTSLFSDFSIIFSNYRFSQEFGSTQKKPSLRQIAFKNLSDYKYSNNLSFRFGFDFNNYSFNVTSGLQNLKNSINYKLYSSELNIFGTMQSIITDLLRADFGLALSTFAESQMTKSFVFVEPRICLTYFFEEELSLKLSYIRMHQSIHMLNSNRFYFPTDILYPSFDKLKPMSGSQSSIGLSNSFNWSGSKFETLFEIYYKDMKNITQFKQNFYDANPASLPNQILSGRGWGYGIEAQLEKREGTTTGWVNYTWNKVFRSFRFKNFDKVFVPKFFKEHQVNIVINHNVSSNLKLNLAFTISSGQHITLPVSEYFILTDNSSDIGGGGFDSNSGYIHYGELNGFKLPLYNRLDLGIVHFFKMWGGNWELFASVYNLYNYPNPTFLWYSINANKFYRTTIGVLPTFGIRFNY